MTEPTYDDTGKLESPIEALFANGVDKYLSEDVRMLYQVSLETPFGRFRVDTLARHERSGVIAIELDGRQFHDPTRDFWRDAALIEAGHVNGVVRISGRHVFTFPAETWFLLGKLEPWLLSARGALVLSQQVHPDCHRAEPSYAGDVVAWAELRREDAEATTQEDEGITSHEAWPDFISIHRHARSDARVRHAVDILARNPHRSLAEIIAMYDAELG